MIVDEIKKCVLKSLETENRVPEVNEIAESLGYSETVVLSIVQKLNVMSDRECTDRLSKLRMVKELRDSILSRRLSIYKDIVRHSLKNEDVLRQVDYMTMYGKAAGRDIRVLVREEIISPYGVKYACTITERDVYEVKMFILHYYMENNMSPTIQELRELTGRGSSYVNNILTALEAESFIKRSPGKHRAIILTAKNGTYVGTEDVVNLLSDMYVNRVKWYVSSYKGQCGNMPTALEVAEALGISQEVVNSILKDSGEKDDNK